VVSTRIVATNDLLRVLRKYGINIALLGLVLSWVRVLTLCSSGSPVFQAECAALNSVHALWSKRMHEFIRTQLESVDQGYLDRLLQVVQVELLARALKFHLRFLLVREAGTTNRARAACVFFREWVDVSSAVWLPIICQDLRQYYYVGDSLADGCVTQFVESRAVRRMVLVGCLVCLSLFAAQCSNTGTPVGV
jgi:hypothetical protein